ncbi:long-chain-fatty-acid--CoA ligase [Nocardia amamiensis]|uniref:long-chain-fatty-acid--CoA ligase n=1 Tax=Nocardia amamiensis TaxID=404578 RepID=UPI0033DF9DB7
MTNYHDGTAIVRGFASTTGDDYQLNTTTLLRHAARTHPEQQIVYRTADGDWDRYSYGECFRRVNRAAGALRTLGVEPGDRIGVLDWNTRRHFELYYAIPGLGAVMLQMNARLSAEDLGYVASHSGASVIAVDESLLPQAEAIAPHVPGVRGWIVLTDRPLSQISTTLEPLYHYEELLAVEPEEFEWPVIDERSAYSACYTTGTTGRPKGVYYSHRAIYLHAMSVAANVGLSMDDCTMLITPMFHVQCWGLPQAATYMATKLVLPGRYGTEDTGVLADAMITEEVTLTSGAPAIFQAMLDDIRAHADKPDLSRTRMLSGASEPPLALMREFRELTGAEVIQVYGATETAPLIAMNRPKPSVRHRLNEDGLWNLKRKQGLLFPGVDFVLLGSNGKRLPHDGKSVGEICVRGPWVTTGYHDLDDADDRFVDGYWRTGDAGTIDPDGYLKLTDRIKDVIKSGGEWISSIDMENVLTAHPAVREAAVVGLPHPKWQERPIAVVVFDSGKQATQDELRAHLSSTFAKWQLPDDFVVTDAVPRTSVGKIDKKRIRFQYADLYLDQATPRRTDSTSHLYTQEES